MLMRDLQRLDHQRWTVAIEDVYLGLMRLTFNFATQTMEIGWVPVEVIVKSQQIDNRPKRKEST